MRCLAQCLVSVQYSINKVIYNVFPTNHTGVFLTSLNNLLNIVFNIYTFHLITVPKFAQLFSYYLRFRMFTFSFIIKKYCNKYLFFLLHFCISITILRNISKIIILSQNSKVIVLEAPELPLKSPRMAMSYSLIMKSESS